MYFYRKPQTLDKQVIIWSHFTLNHILFINYKKGLTKYCNCIL